MDRMDGDDPLNMLRRLCLALPEATERLSHGEPTWFVRGKQTFVMYANHHHDARLACWCAAPLGAQELLIEAEPTRFFRPPYVGVRGWLGVYLDVPVDWDEIADLVEDAYRTVAPKRLIAELDARPRTEVSSRVSDVPVQRARRLRSPQGDVCRPRLYRLVPTLDVEYAGVPAGD